MTILVSAIVSLTLTPMMCAQVCCATNHGPEQSRLYRESERIFEESIAFYGKTLRWVLRHQTRTLVVAVGDAGADDLFCTLSCPRDFSRCRTPA